MLRPARLPSPPGWLQRDKVNLHFTAPSEDIVTPAFGAARCRTALGVRLDGRTGNLPSSGLSPDQSQQLVRLHDKPYKSPMTGVAVTTMNENSRPAAQRIFSDLRLFSKEQGATSMTEREMS